MGRLDGSHPRPAPTRARQQLDLTMKGHQDPVMRTTLTLDPDVAERLKHLVRSGRKGLKATVNEALRIGLGMIEKPVKPAPFRIRAFVAGLQPGVEPDKMNQLLDELEAREFARKQGA